MDILGLVLIVIVKVLPEKVAMPAIAGAVLLLGIGAFSWRSHLEANVAFCNSPSGRLAQLMNGSAMSSCGADSALSLVALLLGIGLLAVALAPLGVWIYQLTHPQFHLKEVADELV